MEDSNGNWPSLSKILYATAVVAVAAVAFVVATAGTGATVLGVAISASVAATASNVAIGAASLAVVCFAASGISRTAEVVKDVAESTKCNGPARDQSVYVMRDKSTNEVQYVGRTNDPIRRQNEHRKDSSKDHLGPLEVKFTGLTKLEARVMEQVLISAYTMDSLDNARREIAVGKISGFAGHMDNIISIYEGVAEDELLNLMGR